MLSKADLPDLLHLDTDGHPVLSLYLDMSVNSDNKRTYGLFLNKQRGHFADSAGARNDHLAGKVGAALDRVEGWIDRDFEESNRGVAIFVQLGGDWMQAYQFAVPIENRLEIDEAPVITPLVRLLGSWRHHGVLLVDREHLRMISVYMGRPVREHQVDTQPYPAPHDIRRGGYSARDYQSRKAEEVRHFFKEFAQEVREFDQRYQPDDYVVLGTDENVRNFLEYLPEAVRNRVAHTAHAPLDATSAELLDRLSPALRARDEHHDTDALLRLKERVGQEHYATAGFARTLEQLQEGKVQTLVVAADVDRRGSRCRKCGFYLAGTADRCPYCGGETRDGVDLIETMVRLAAEHDADVAFVDAGAMERIEGVGALLRF